MSRPRKSAVAIVLTRDADGLLRVLIGRRNPKLRLLGGYYAFPGGAIEETDGSLDTEAEEDVLRRTASRELAEETGVIVPADAFQPAGRRITPPFVPVRFDSLMFVAEVETARAIEPEVPGELLDIRWASPQALRDEWRDLSIRVAPPLIPILQQLAEAEAETLAEIAARLRVTNAFMEDDGPRIEFVPDVLMMPIETPTLPPATTTNCYWVGARELVVIDPGSAEPEACARLLRHLRRREEEGARAKAVVLTHHHGDHVGGARTIARELNVPVFAHPRTWDALGDWDVVREPLEDGGALELAGGERLVALHTPGHAIGHLALFEERRGSLFAGDLVSGVSTILVDSSPGSLDVYLASLERIRDLGARTLFPAHGPPMISPAADVQRILDHRAKREVRILDAIGSRATTVAEIVRQAYADTPHADPGLAAAQAASHLDRLERHGRVRRDGSGWSRVG